MRRIIYLLVCIVFALICNSAGGVSLVPSTGDMHTHPDVSGNQTVDIYP